MNNKLKKAFDAASKLPPAEQDALAAAILEEVKVDGLWEASFAKKPAVLERLADEALEEHRTGRTRPLDPDQLWNPTQRSGFARHSLPCRRRCRPRRVSPIRCFSEIHFIQVFASSRSILHARSIQRVWG